MAPNTAFPQIYDENPAPVKQSRFKGFFPSKAHKRTTSAGAALAEQRTMENSYQGFGPILPLDHPHAYPQRPLGERMQSRDNCSPQPTRKPVGKDGVHTHKKTKSAVSLKSLMRNGDAKDEKPTGKAAAEADGDGGGDRSPKKTKSATSLSAILRRSHRGRKGSQKEHKDKDKENRTPPGSTDEKPFSPIWAQFATQPLQDQTESSYVPERNRSIHDEISLYTPKGYSPSNQRDFHDYQPSLTRRPEPKLQAKPRPKSEHITSSALKDYLGSIKRTASHGKSDGKARDGLVAEAESGSERSRAPGPKKGSRVMAAIAAFSAKEKEAKGGSAKSLSPVEIENAFEKLLDARNIPEIMRKKMRSLDTNIKADFIEKDKIDSAVAAPASANPHSGGSTRSQRSNKKEGDGEEQTSSSRSRGRSYILGKNEPSPTKKNRSESGTSHKRTKSADVSRPASSRSLATSGSTNGLATAAQPDLTVDPTDFIHYLREVQRPEIVEVGKMHKLRILLRNETVAWVDSFISHGGMDEIVGLLYRIMKVEWREEHEDTLLHETLLCLKALCTTSIALRRLSSVEADLFPALLAMLFDEEKKGPSEFTTRGIIISLLNTHLCAATEDQLAKRASNILSYLRDPAPPTERKPLTFLAEIYQPRPYRIWSKEVSNVTKEVFWIFLHHMNVIPRTPASDDVSTDEPYSRRHFPPVRPPVPAAPYVGGVEWDATNYIASHLDLMNGLIASIPTQEGRNDLRGELRASGFEKIMGASLRTCKEKFHSAVHDGLKTWVAAAAEDGWEYRSVREGPPREQMSSPAKSPVKPSSPKKKAGGVSDEPPKLDLAVSVSKPEKETAKAVDMWL